jgi:heat-inducible transcriptional repressor
MNEKTRSDGNRSRLPPPLAEELSERGRRLLKALIEHYIRDGQPVGSRTLARSSGLELSPASIRNIMADLEEMGYLRSPHTSAGRIPTDRGFRFFVDSLLTVNPPDASAADRLREQLEQGADIATLLSSTSSALSDLTHMAGLVTVPRHDHSALRHLEFLPLSGNRVLAILVVNEREVQNRVIETDRPYTRAELERATNFITEQFAGRDLTAIRRALLADMRRDRDSLNHMMQAAIDMADKVLNAEAEEDFVLAGQANLMGFSELADVTQLQRLFQAFQEKREILHLLDRCIHATELQIFIGEEVGTEVLTGLSIVGAPYRVGGEVLGVLGVIGPTRMAYQRVIPIVDLTARLLGAALNPQH